MQHVYRFTRLSLAIIFFIGINTNLNAQVFHPMAGMGYYNQGFSGDGGPATSAELSNPTGVAVDRSGNVYIADYSNSRIRKVAAGTGIITTVAGTTNSGYSGDGGAATSAELYGPTGVAVDNAGNLYIADCFNNRVRKVATGTGIITTVAGLGSAGYSNDGGAATSAELDNPTAVAVDTITGALYIADRYNNSIRKVVAGIITTVAGNEFEAGFGYGSFSGDGGPATSAELNLPNAVAVDKLGNLYIADENNYSIRKVTASTGYISTIVGNGSTSGNTGDGGPASAAFISNPTGVAIDAAGNIYIADNGNATIRRIGVNDTITTITGQSYPSYTGTNVEANTAYLNNPYIIGLDKTGNLFIPDENNYQIVEILMSGPNITVQPPPTTYACNDSGVYIPITVTGASTYQWMVDSTGTWQNVVNGTGYSGATTNTLYITKTSTSYNISYMCVINGGYVNSNASYLSVNYPPSVMLTYPDSICPGAPTQISGQVYVGYKIKPHGLAKSGFVHWSTGDTTSTITVSPMTTTTYTVAINDGNCTTDTSITVVVMKPTVKANIFPSASICAGSTVNLYGTGGTTYTWSSGVINNQPYSPPGSGKYIVTGINYEGCIEKDSLVITVNPSPTVTVSSLPLNDSVCKGSAVTLTGSGAVSYNWSGGITNGVGFTPSYSAVYYVTGTDANGCTGTNQANVFVRNLPIISASASPSGSVCQGSSVTLDGNGGVSYSWSSGVTNSVPFIPASSGTYTVTGTDAFGCSNSTTLGITINSLPNIKGNAFPSANLCQGSSVALIGTGGSSYAWSGGVNNGVGFTPSSTVTYTVTGVDANGCTNTDSVTVAVNPKVVITTTSNNTTCGLINGSAVAAGSNGTPPYRYSWNNPVSPDSAISNLGPGTYIVTVLDTAGCSNTAAVSIGSSTAPILSVTTTASNCSQATGSAIVSVTGGTTPYRYMWNNGDTLSSNYNLKAATYIVTVTDVNNCSTFAPGIVTNANGPAITSSITDVACNGMATGAISITVTGGTAPYTYAWSNGATTSSIGSLNAGPYQVTVTDADSCSSIESFTVNQPKNPIALTYTSAKADCSTSDGSASVSVTGGVSPYTYAWSTGATATNITNVSAGVYEVSITDKNGCVDSAHIAVSNKTGPSVSISIAGNANCGNGGIVSVTATGGTSPYTYMWSNGATATDITNIPAGVYTVSVTDKLGCIGTADTTVTEVLPPMIPLCIVTVDPTMNKNVVLWDNPIVGSSNISYYNVYKESTKAGVYFKVAQVPYDSLSQFVDTLSNPSVRSWRYELSQVDTCGNESPLSPPHKTMHVTVNQGLGNTINLIWDNYEGLAFSTYYVYRDTIFSNFTKLDSIPNNIYTYTDSKPFNTTSPVYYRIGIDYASGCTPHTKAKTYNASHSNTANIIFVPTGIATINAGNDALNIYPNPNNGMFTVSLSLAKSNQNVSMKVYDDIGQVIYTENCGKVQTKMTKQMGFSAYSKGVYFIQLISDNNVYYRRVVVQ